MRQLGLGLPSAEAFARRSVIGTGIINRPKLYEARPQDVARLARWLGIEVCLCGRASCLNAMIEAISRAT